jgi:uncharacterized protein (DUF2126 family)
VDFAFDMRVDRVAEHPRITKPFNEESWAALDALGQDIDAKLKAGDVRLTMGGEPTFVSIDDFESEEWNTAAVGPQKREAADKLIRRLRNRFAPGGFLHYGQGKWYPGETLPRWTFSLYWRRDGKPIWFNPELIAEEGKDTGQATPETAKDLLAAIADNLGIEDDHVVPAYEDPAEWILKEGNLPDNVTPDNSKLEDAEERHRIATVFSRGLATPSGFVLPVQRWQSKAAGHGWRSEKWKTRRGHVFWSRATARSDTACRWVRCRMFRRPPIHSSIRPTRPSRRAICRIRPARLSMMPWQTRVPPMPRRRRAPSSPPRGHAATGRADHRRSRRSGAHGDFRRTA